MDEQTVSRPDVEEFLTAQRELVDLSREELERRWSYAPDQSRVFFGTGYAAEFTLLGNPQHPFYGVAIFNDSAKTIYVGFQSGQAQGSSLYCPPKRLLVWPARFKQLSLAVSIADSEAAATSVTVLRLQVPPPSPALSATA